ncbi:MAG: ABC transporter substrate-binding protein, partial [Rhodospirillaceae bacterium]
MIRTSQWPLAKASILALVVIWLTGPASFAQSPAALRVAVPGLPLALDPHHAVTATELVIAQELFVGLVTRNARGEVVSGLAERWDVSPDGLVYTFRLRRDAAWSDGKSLTGDDFVYALRRAIDPDTDAPFAGELLAVAGAGEIRAGYLPLRELGIESLPFGQLRITLSRPSANFLEVLSRPIAAPVPRHDVGNPEGVDRVLTGRITNGAFYAVKSDNGLTLHKSPKSLFAGDVDRVEFIVADSRQTASALVRRGDAHLTLGFPVDLEVGSAALQANIDKGRDLYFVAVNVARPPFDTREARHALAMTVDRRALVKALDLAGTKVAFKIVPPEILSERLSPRAPYAALRPEMRRPIAEVLLEESEIGSTAPRNFTLIFPQGDAHALAANFLRETWKPLGIQLELEPLAAARYAEALTAGDFDLALAAWPRRSAGSMGFLEP